QLLRRDHGSAQRLLVEATWHSSLRSAHRAITFVFDGPAPQGGPGSRTGLRLLYPEPGQSADQRILEVVAQLRHARSGVLVASSDRGLRDLVRGLGGNTVGAQAVLQKLGGAPAGPRSTPAKEAGKPLPSPMDTQDWLRRFEKRRPGGGQKAGDSR
ncbi:MAG: NYN domain-containing protein, partial [Candidatus Dormibacteria bacterium]